MNDDRPPVDNQLASQEAIFVCWHTEHHFAATAAAPRQARTFAIIELGRALSGPAVDILEDAALVLSELVTNAVSAGGEPITATLDLHQQLLRISVLDHAPGWPTMPSSSTDRPHGRGLLVVEALTAEWGVDVAGDGKRVWACLPLPGELTMSLNCSHAELTREAASGRPSSTPGRRDQASSSWELPLDR